MREIVREYDYVDEDGTLLYQTVRFRPKDFRQRRPHGQSWEWNLEGVKRVLYQLPGVKRAIAKGETIFIVEGERDVDTLTELGLTATTNSGCAGKWTDSYSDALEGADVCTIPDADEAGRKHANAVSESLLGKARHVRLLELPSAQKKSDISDWVERGRTAEELLRLASEAPDFEMEGRRNVSSPLSPSPPPWQPFPIHALPERIGRYVSTVSKAIGCDVAMVALPVLVCLAGAIGNRRRLRLKRSWTEPAILWAAVVARSGALKSPALDEVTRHLRQREAEEIKAEQRRKAEYEQELASWNELPKGKRGERPAVPEPAARLVISDVTVEALAARHSHSPAGLLLVRDEIAGWMRSFDAYKKGAGGDAQQWLEMHRAEPVIVDRKTRGTISVPRASVSIIGGVQRETLLASLGIEHWVNGLAARLLFAMPPERTKRWTDADIPEDVRSRWAKLLDELLALPVESEPVELPMDPEARQLFVRFYNDQARKEADAENDSLASALAKLEGYTARIALVLQLAGDPSSTCVGARAMDSAVKLTRWFAAEAERVYATMGETPAGHDQRRLIDWIAGRGGAVTERELSRGPRPYRKPGAAETALTELVKAGRGNWRQSSAGGRPTRVFVLASIGDGSESQISAEEIDDSSPWHAI